MFDAEGQEDGADDGEMVSAEFWGGPRDGECFTTRQGTLYEGFTHKGGCYVLSNDKRRYIWMADRP